MAPLRPGRAREPRGDLVQTRSDSGGQELPARDERASRASLSPETRRPPGGSGRGPGQTRELVGSRQCECRSCVAPGRHEGGQPWCGEPQRVTCESRAPGGGGGGEGAGCGGEAGPAARAQLLGSDRPRRARPTGQDTLFGSRCCPSRTPAAGRHCLKDQAASPRARVPGTNVEGHPGLPGHRPSL